MVLEAGSSRVRSRRQGLVSGGNSLPDLQLATSSPWWHMALPLITRRKTDISLSPPHLIRPLILLNQGPTLCHCYSVAESYLTLCIPMDCNRPGFLDLHHLPEFAQIHVHWVKVKSEDEVAQSCLTLCNPMDCSLPGFSVHEILQTRILEWVAISFSRRSSCPRNWTWVSR